MFLPTQVFNVFSGHAAVSACPGAKTDLEYWWEVETTTECEFVLNVVTKKSKKLSVLARTLKPECSYVLTLWAAVATDLSLVSSTQLGW